MIIRASAFVGNKWVVGGLSGLYAAFVAVTVWVFCTGATTAPAAWYELAGESGCFANYEGDVMGVRLGVSATFSVYCSQNAPNLLSILLSGSIGEGPLLWSDCGGTNSWLS